MDDQGTNRDRWGKVGLWLAIGFAIVVLLVAVSLVATVIQPFFSH
jgi:hypothetical protein